MKNLYVKDLKSGTDTIDLFLMVKSIGIRVGSNQKQFLDMTLTDSTGEVNAKKWTVSPDEEPFLSSIKEGDIVKIRAQVKEWMGQTQLNVQRIRLASPADDLVMSDYIKAAPEAPEDMYSFILGIAEGLKDEDLRKITTKVLTDNKYRLMYYPAAAKNHHAEFGGLLWHTKRMLMSGEVLCSVYPFLNKELVLAGVILHDIEKLNEIDAGENGMATGYSKKGQLLGHIIQGVILIDELCKELDIPEEKSLVLEHMVLSHHYEPEFGSPKKPMFPEAELLHYLDILDARMYDMEEAVSGVEPGFFSDRVRTLDNRKIYKPEFGPAGQEPEFGPVGQDPVEE